MIRRNSEFWKEWDDMCDRHSDRMLDNMIKDRKEIDVG